MNAAELPAGKHGFLSARGTELLFADGTSTRFWGTNLTAYALFGTPKPEVERTAKRLAQLGFNLVRLHHFDSSWVSPNIFGPKGSPTTQLDPDMVEKLDWWIKCLREQGIYIWLDLHVGREVRAADRIDAFSELAQGKSSGTLNGYNFVNDSVRQAMQHFDEQLLDHKNRYTELRYKDDPAIAVMLISNENDLTHHFGNALLPDKHVPYHTSLYLRRARSFADQHQLPYERVWRAWQEGPSKLFLNDLEKDFDADMIAYLRGLGVRALLAPTSTWGLNPLSSLPALTLGDLIDVHSYGGRGELNVDPSVSANIVHWLAAAQLLDKPLTVSEWGIDRDGLIAEDRQDLPLYIAGTAALQGWKAVMFYAYSQEALGGAGKASVYQAYNDPALLSSMPAAALLYRQGHVAESTTTYVFAPGVERLFQRSISPANSVALRTAAERGKLAIAMPAVSELPWLKATPIPRGVKVLQDPDRSELPPGATEVSSDTHELTRKWRQGVFEINTARTQAIMGALCCETVALPNLRLRVNGSNVVVAAQSLDESAIGSSRQIMITVGAGAAPTADKDHPYKSNTVVGSIRVKASQGLRLFGWDDVAGKPVPRTVSYRNGEYLIVLDGAATDSWLFLRASPTM